MLDKQNVSAYEDDRRGFTSHGRARYGLLNVLAVVTAIVTLGVMVFGPGACANPAGYLLGWFVLTVSTLVAVAPLVDRLPDECFDDEEES